MLTYLKGRFKQRGGDRKRRTFIYFFTSQMVTMREIVAVPGALNLHPVLPHEWQGASFTASEGVHDQEAELEVKSWRLKPNILMWHSDTPSSN